jgi:hypothetical protein
MLGYLPPIQKKVITRLVPIMMLLSCGLDAQNFTDRVAGFTPFGVNGPLPFGRASDRVNQPAFKGGLSYGVAMNSAYDTNFFQREDGEESELLLSLTPSITHTTDPEGGAKMAISTAYRPTANMHMHHSELNSVDHSGSVSMIVSGSRTTLSAYAGYSQDSGADRLAGGFFTGSSLNLGLQGSYQLAPRTTVNAGWSSSITDYANGENAGGDSAVGFDGHSFDLGGFWSATERLSIGPSLSHTTNTSDKTGRRDSWGLALQVNYKPAEKIQLAGTLGFQHSENSRDDGGGDVNLTGSLNASYQINERWSWANSIQSGVLPSPTVANYVINNWSVNSSLQRTLLIGSVGLGADMQFSNFESVGPTGILRSDENYLGVFISYQRPLLNDRVRLSSMVRYAINDGNSDWSQVQLNVGISMEF